MKTGAETVVDRQLGRREFEIVHRLSGQCGERAGLLAQRCIRTVAVGIRIRQFNAFHQIELIEQRVTDRQSAGPLAVRQTFAMRRADHQMAHKTSVAHNLALFVGGLVRVQGVVVEVENVYGDLAVV